MKYIDDLEEVMHITGETNYVELQKKGYDVLSYLKRKQEKILSKIEEIQSIIDECSSVASGSKKNYEPNPYGPKSNFSDASEDDLHF
ncbi:MAG: hypothetical protein IJ254_07525 [Succinivibrio sp.]|nr:hypothetical protein [Succinivibrio sp.]